MRRTVLALATTSALCGLFAACARDRPPPRVCELPPPEKKKQDVRVGTCPIEWGTDAGADALAPDADTDAHPDG